MKIIVHTSFLLLDNFKQIKTQQKHFFAVLQLGDHIITNLTQTRGFASITFIIFAYVIVEQSSYYALGKLQENYNT